MISVNCIFEYRKLYPEDRCFIGEPGSLVMIESNELKKTFFSPFDENDELFLERLNRSKQHNHNYFYDEWNLFNSDNDVRY